LFVRVESATSWRTAQRVVDASESIERVENVEIAPDDSYYGSAGENLSGSPGSTVQPYDSANEGKSMVLINRKVDYALLALVHLMKHPTGCSAREVAGQYNLSRPFLANILKELCHHGFVESFRGINGGYRLAKIPAAVTVEQVIGALDGPFQLMSCASSDAAGSCGLVDVCPVKSPLRVVHERMAAVLGQTTLEDLGRQTVVPLKTETQRNDCVADLSG
jgi:Rrf2 family protein